MPAVRAIEPLAAGGAQAWTRSLTQRLYWQVGKDILPQQLVEVDFVMLIDTRLLVDVRQLYRIARAQIDAWQELLVEGALDLDSHVVQTARTFQRHWRDVVAVD